MTRERLQTIRALATVLLDDIEWCSLPGVPLSFEAGIREEFAALLAMPDFRTVVRRDLERCFDAVDGKHEQIPDRQEVIQQAAGMVQLSLCRAIDTVWSDVGVLDVGVVTKFHRLSAPIRLATGQVIVPSLAEQSAGARPYSPPGAGGPA